VITLPFFVVMQWRGFSLTRVVPKAHFLETTAKSESPYEERSQRTLSAGAL
jgi:hypothetical protein